MPGERRLGRRLGSADESGQPVPARSLGDGDRARNGTHATVERELADAAVLEQPLRRELIRAGEQRERDRQVEARSLLAQRRRREVDRDPVAAGPRQHRVDDAAVHAVLRLLAGAVGEPDDRERRQIGRDEVRLDLDAARLEADDGRGEGSREHTSDGTGQPVPCLSRESAESCAGYRGAWLRSRRRRESTRSTRRRAGPCGG